MPAAEQPVVLFWRLVGIVLLGLGAGWSQAQPAPPPTTALVFGQLLGPDGLVTTEWQLPDGEPRAWVLLQHGFGRHCANLRETARRLARNGLATLCLQADMADGAPALAALVARALQAPSGAQLGVPGSTVAAQRWVLAGHSAGALFAARVGQALVQMAPQRVAGLVLLDPVGGPALANALSAVSAQGLRPVWALLAPPSRCNAQQQALPALRQIRAEALTAGRSGFVGMELLGSATHLDAEGEDTEALAVWLCGEGRPQPASTEIWRRLLLDWSLSVSAPSRTVDAGLPPWLAPATVRTID